LAAFRDHRRRVRDEIFKGSEIKGAHRSGTELAAATILGYAVCAYAAYFLMPNPITGAVERLDFPGEGGPA
jgi:fatty acid desaturase (delta-4 desaturase)